MTMQPVAWWTRKNCHPDICWKCSIWLNIFWYLSYLYVFIVLNHPKNRGSNNLSPTQLKDVMDLQVLNKDSNRTYPIIPICRWYQIDHVFQLNKLNKLYRKVRNRRICYWEVPRSSGDRSLIHWGWPVDLWSLIIYSISPPTSRVGYSPLWINK
jgi:hypothetical protein